jgi:aryl-alcohol dehydrogenase-like predicted oxidoreductase
MSSIDFREHRILGRTGLSVSRIGLSGGYGVGAAGVEKAFHEYGINYFYWCGRKPGMRETLKNLVKTRRDEITIAIQSYDHLGFYLHRSVDKALNALGVEHADVLFLGWFNSMPRKRLIDNALKLKESGRVRFLGLTGHNRKFHGALAHDPNTPFDVQMVRYNAAHRGAEQDVFPDLPEVRPGFSTYTATRWGKLLKANKMPEGEPPMSAAECYRFALSHPAVDQCLAGPRNEREMHEGLAAIDQGPLNEDELARVRKIGDFVHG